MEIEPFKVDLYIRVSTDKQVDQGDSLEEQENELKKYCEYRGFQIHNVLIEKGRSGGNTNRPEYQRLVNNVKDKKINAVVVKKLDRLSRSLLDFEQLMSLLLENSIEFISLKESFDTSTAMGKAMLRVALVFAQLEREQTSERITDVMAYRASQGLYNGGITPVGYTNVSKELVPYPKERQIVELIYQQFLEFKSTTKTARFLNETGYRGRGNKLWDDRLILKILTNPVYIGKVRWKGQEYQGIHQPIISEKRFSSVQDIFRNRIQVKGKSKTKAILQRLIFCGKCDAPMTPSYALNRHKVKYYYYRCTNTLQAEKGYSNCPIKYVPMSEFEDRIIQLLIDLPSEPLFSMVERPALRHNQDINQKLSTIKEEIHLQEIRVQELKSKKDKYLDTLIMGNFNSSERQHISSKLNEMELEEKQLRSSLYKNQFELSQAMDDLIDLTQVKQVFIGFKADYTSYSGDEIRKAMVSIFDKIIIFSDKMKIQFKALPWPIEIEN